MHWVLLGWHKSWQCYYVILKFCEIFLNSLFKFLLLLILNLFSVRWAFIMLSDHCALARSSAQWLISPTISFFLSFFLSSWAFVVLSGRWALAHWSAQWSFGLALSFGLYNPNKPLISVKIFALLSLFVLLLCSSFSSPIHFSTHGFGFTERQI